jgi:Ni/Co efflux regulator RcnB
VNKLSVSLLVSCLAATLVMAPLPFAVAQDASGEQQAQTEGKAGSDQEQNEKDEANEKNNEQAGQEQQENPDRRSRGNRDTFIPSEEISDDLSVSFPVDI